MGNGELLGRLAALVTCIGCAALGLVIWVEPTTPRQEHLKLRGLTLFVIGVSFMLLLALDALCRLRRRRRSRDRPDA